MSLPTAAPSQYDRVFMQQVLNELRIMQGQITAPRKSIAMVDITTGEQQVIQVDSGTVVANDP